MWLGWVLLAEAVLLGAALLVEKWCIRRVRRRAECAAAAFEAIAAAHPELAYRGERIAAADLYLIPDSDRSAT